MYAERNGYIIKEWYIDRAYSGKTVNRPDFQRLMKDIGLKDCPYTAVLVHKLDRFSRNAAEALKYKGILCDYEIDLVSTVETKSKTTPMEICHTVSWQPSISII